MKPAVRNLILVLLIAVVATIGIRISLASTPAHQPVQPVHVLVAATDLPAGLLLRENEFIWASYPGDAVPPNAIMQNSTEAKTLPGSLLHNPISKNTPILASDIISPTSPGFLAATLKPQLRAVSVAINDVSGNAGLIQPGDYVDLLLTQSLRDSKSPAHSVASEIIATGLRVIAVGTSLQRSKSSDLSATVMQARTVTLEVTPRAAEVVNVAARIGELSLALRSFATDDPNVASSHESVLIADKLDLNASAPSNGPVWAGDISQADRAAPAALAGTVQILRGGAAGNQSGATPSTTPQ